MSKRQSHCYCLMLLTRVETLPLDHHTFGTDIGSQTSFRTIWNSNRGKGLEKSVSWARNWEKSKTWIKGIQTHKRGSIRLERDRRTRTEETAEKAEYCNGKGQWQDNSDNCKKPCTTNREWEKILTFCQMALLEYREGRQGLNIPTPCPFFSRFYLIWWSHQACKTSIFPKKKKTLKT